MRFVTFLEVALLSDGKTWILEAPLVFESDSVGEIVVPQGFTTDFASVPRLPLIYLLAGDTAHAAAVVHDYLYTTCQVTRSQADKVFLEAMEYTMVPKWRRNMMYWAVRVFGGARYGSAN